MSKSIHWLGVSVYLKDLVLLAFVDLASQAAVGQGVLDDVLVGLGAGLLVQLGPCVTSSRSRVVITTRSSISMEMERARVIPECPAE